MIIRMQPLRELDIAKGNRDRLERERRTDNIGRNQRRKRERGEKGQFRIERKYRKLSDHSL